MLSSSHRQTYHRRSAKAIIVIDVVVVRPLFQYDVNFIANQWAVVSE